MQSSGDTGPHYQIKDQFEIGSEMAEMPEMVDGGGCNFVIE